MWATTLVLEVVEREVVVVDVVEVVVAISRVFSLKGFLRKTGAISLVLFKGFLILIFKGMLDRSAARTIENRNEKLKIIMSSV